MGRKKAQRIQDCDLLPIVVLHLLGQLLESSDGGMALDCRLKLSYTGVERFRAQRLVALSTLFVSFASDCALGSGDTRAFSAGSSSVTTWPAACDDAVLGE